MSDATAILLPAAGVDFFVTDEGTANLAELLSADWRFARVELSIRKDNIDAATAAYTDTESPELVIIETDDIGEGFIKKLEALAAVCAEGTDAIIIGPTNDVHLYRSLVGMGVRDYLVRPVSQEDMVGVIAGALVEKHGLTGARLVAVVGGKGGVGTTTIAQILAWNIAENLQQKTLLLDAAGSNSTLGVAYGVEPTTSFSDAVRIGVEGSEDDINRIILGMTDHLSILVCGGDPVLGVRPTPDNVEDMVNRFLQRYPVLVMDLSASSRAVQQRMITIAAEVVAVTTPMLSALRNTRTYMGEIRDMRNGLDEVDLIINMHGMAGKEEVPIKDIEEAMDKKASALIPYAPKIFAASESSGKPVGKNADAKSIMKSLMLIAERSAGTKAAKSKGEAVHDSKSGSGIFSFLKKG